MTADPWLLYRHMLRSRLFEETVSRLWRAGEISGEMHLGTGEEAVAAGVVSHLRDGDAMTLDHRATPPLLVRGVDPVALLKELLGRPDGLCRGRGGHMHLFSPEHLAASSGIVGACGPAAVGFALSARALRPGAVAVAFFGEGALNQGMLMESLNLAASWRLPVLFVCKDDDWAISTLSSSVTAAGPAERARLFGLGVEQADGSDVEEVWSRAGAAVARARNGGGPTFLLARCVHLDGHMLGDALLRAARRPFGEGRRLAGPLLRSALRARGAAAGERLESLQGIASLLRRAARDHRPAGRDPLARARERLAADRARLEALEEEVRREIRQVEEAAREGAAR